MIKFFTNPFRKFFIVFLISFISLGVHAQSFVSISLGAGIPTSQASIYYDQEEFGRAHSAFNANIEAAFFSNPYMGFGGSFLISNNNAFMRGMLGPYLSIPFGDRLLIQGKALFGWLNGAHCPGIGFVSVGGGNEYAGYDFCIPITGYAIGASIRHKLNDYLAIGVSFDYTSEFGGGVPDDPTLVEYIPTRYFHAGFEIAYMIF